MEPQATLEESFGKFRLRRRLGIGGMAEVYLAELTGPEGFTKSVALKRILPHLGEDEEFIASFISEARLGGQLNHPNIVQTLELGRQDTHYFLAMEYVDGITLAQLIRHRRLQGVPLPLPCALEIARQICEGLAYAHIARDTQGAPLKMIHRDLKPDNILLSKFGAAKITDFGVAKAESNLRRTVAGGTLKGTVAYMSPEQARGESIDTRSDLYSVGTLLFELLTLERLYPRAKGMTGLQEVAQGDVSERIRMLEIYPRGLTRLVSQLLEADREARFATAAEVKDELMRLAGTLPVSFIDLSTIIQEVMEARANTRSAEAWSQPFQKRGEAEEADSLPRTLMQMIPGPAGGHAPVPKTSARWANGQRADGPRAPGQQADGPRAPGQQADGPRAPGQQADGPRAPGQQADGPRAPGQQADGPRAPGQQADGQRAPGQQADGQRAPGQQADGQRTARHPPASPRGARRQGEGSREDGQKDLETSAPSASPVPPLATPEPLIPPAAMIELDDSILEEISLDEPVVVSSPWESQPMDGIAPDGPDNIETHLYPRSARGVIDPQRGSGVGGEVGDPSAVDGDATQLPTVIHEATGVPPLEDAHLPNAYRLEFVEATPKPSPIVPGGVLGQLLKQGEDEPELRTGQWDLGADLGLDEFDEEEDYEALISLNLASVLAPEGDLSEEESEEHRQALQQLAAALGGAEGLLVPKRRPKTVPLHVSLLEDSPESASRQQGVQGSECSPATSLPAIPEPASAPPPPAAAPAAPAMIPPGGWGGPSGSIGRRTSTASVEALPDLISEGPREEEATFLVLTPSEEAVAIGTTGVVESQAGYAQPALADPVVAIGTTGVVEPQAGYAQPVLADPVVAIGTTGVVEPQGPSERSKRTSSTTPSETEEVGVEITLESPLESPPESEGVAMGILETVDPPSSSQAGSPPSSTTGDDAPHGGVTSLLGPEFGHDWTDSGVVEEPSETIALVSEILWAEEESAQSGALEQRHSGIFGVAQPAGRLDTNDGAQSGQRSKGRGDSDEPLLPHPEELAHGALLPDFGAEPFFGSVGASRPTVHSGHTRVLEYEEAALRGDGDLAVAEQYASQGKLGKNPDVSPRARPRTPRSLARGMAEGLREELHQALEEELLPVGVPVPADPPSELPFQVDRVQAGGISEQPEQHEDTSQLEKGATEFERPQLLISGHGYSVSPWWWTALGAAVIFGIAYALFG